MKKVALVLLTLVMSSLCFVKATAQDGKPAKKKNAKPETESGNPAPSDSINYYQKWIATNNLVIFRNQTISDMRRDSASMRRIIVNQGVEISNLQDSLQAIQGTQGSSAARITDLEGQIKRLKNRILEMQEREDAEVTLTTPEMAELVKDSITTELIKNLGLGEKFGKMTAEELASAYSGLNLFVHRPNEENKAMQKGVQKLKDEIEKWMRYMYKNTRNGADRVRYKFLFESITGKDFSR